MARCRFLGCREPIERLEGTETWVREGTVSPDGMAGEVYCPKGRLQVHEPLIPVTVELHPGHPDNAADWDWCQWYDACNQPAAFLVAGEVTTCYDHVSAALENRLMLLNDK